MVRSLHIILPGLLCFLQQVHGAARHSQSASSALVIEAVPVTEISPVSITAGLPARIILYGDTLDGEVAGFFPDCKNATPTTRVTTGTNEYTVFTVDVVAKNLRLCYLKKDASAAIEVPRVSLSTVKPTEPSRVAAFGPDSVTRGRNITINLTSSTSNFSLVGGKAVFIPVDEKCRSVMPTTTLKSNGTGVFSILGIPGDYKLCYQDPGGSDSIEQPQAGLLQVDPAASTPPDLIESIFPTSTSVNALTTIYFKNANQGDKAYFVNSVTGRCNSSSNGKDVSMGHNQFLMPSTGTYTLCYKMADIYQAVAQEKVSLTVKYGITPDMLDKWPNFYRKEGTVTCSELKQFAFCAAASIDVCEKSFTVLSGVGYRCKWYTESAAGPPYCDTANVQDKRNICIKNSCGGKPEQCW